MAREMRSKEEKRRLQYFNKMYDSSKDRRDELRHLWHQYKLAFDGLPWERNKTHDSSIDSWRSNVRIQYGKQQILTLASQLSVDDLPTFQVEPRHYTQDAYSKVVQGMNAYQFDRDNYVEKRQLSSIVAGIYGACPVKIHWLYRTQKMNVRDEFGGLREIEAVVDDRPTAELLHPDNFLFDPKAPQPDQWRYAGHRQVVPLHQLKEAKRADGSNMYKNLNLLEDGVAAAEEQSREPNKSNEKSKMDRSGIEVIELWTRDRVIVRAGGKVIIRDEPNPFHHGQIPFVLVMTQPSPTGDSWGMSEIDPIVDAQQMLWSIDQSSQNALKLSIDPPLSIDVSGGDIENAEKPLEPGARFTGKGNAGDFVRPMNVTGVDYFTSANASDHIQSKMEFSTGITREIAGQSNAGSATEAAINERQSKSRITLKLRSVDNGWAKIAEQFIMLSQQFLDTTQPVRVMGDIGERWQQIDPADIAGLWNVRPRNSSERALKEIEIENTSRALEVIMPLLSPEFVTAQGNTIDAEALVSTLVQILSIDPSKVIVPAEALQQQVVEMQQTYQQADAEAMAMEMVEEVLGGTDEPGAGAEGGVIGGGDAPPGF